VSRRNASSPRPRFEVALERGPPLGLVRGIGRIVVVVRLDEEQPAGEGKEQRNRDAGERESYSIVSRGLDTADGQESRGKGDAGGARPCEPAVVAQGPSGANVAAAQRCEEDAGRGTGESTRGNRDGNGSHAAIITPVGRTA